MINPDYNFPVDKLSPLQLSTVIISCLVVMTVTLFTIEFGTAQTTYATGQVIGKESVQSEVATTTLYIADNKRIYAVEVSRSYSDSVAIGEHLLLIQYHGRITGFQYGTRLYDAPKPLLRKMNSRLLNAKGEASALFSICTLKPIHPALSSRMVLFFSEQLAVNNILQNHE